MQGTVRTRPYPLRSENDCRDSGRRNEAARAAGVRIAIWLALRPVNDPGWQVRRTGVTLRLTVMHVHHGHVSLSRTLRFLSASERFSQSRE